MTAIPAPSDSLLDMFFVRTGLLVREAKKSTLALVLFGPTTGFYQRVAAKAKFMLAATSAVATMKESTETMLDSTEWFSSFYAQLADADPIGNEDIERVLTHIESGQDSLKDLQQGVLRSIPILSKSAISPKMKASRVGVAHRLEKAVASQYSVLENIRWALLEQLADKDIAAGKVSEAYSSIEDLFASLKR